MKENNKKGAFLEIIIMNLTKDSFKFNTDKLLSVFTLPDAKNHTGLLS